MHQTSTTAPLIALFVQPVHGSMHQPGPAVLVRSACPRVWPLPRAMVSEAHTSSASCAS
ncbi:hypothetical protein COCVIDRAFT_87767 [Bipolaris victoriae FI3]|uniref:Uncharacterized protein n=1 Tax=Bipolaris victoriae (strain FI3) TaxID=930091 RepID=W7EWS1_BIPV3|nr:hypothetical protein COCVIDRAFT_87767 [Bipolaris victoriae FI3]